MMISMLILGISCAQIRYQEDISDYQDEVTMLKSRLLSNPDDAEARRDLGIIYFQTKNYHLAREYLQQALAKNPDDPRTLLFAGLSLEFERQEPLALKIYERYPEISRLSPYRKLMEGRYNFLNRQLLREEMRQLLKEEKEISTKNLSDKSVAIFPFIYRGTNPKYSPLGKGLSEMMIIDLDRIEGLHILERVRLQALLNELSLSHQQYMDPSSAPRLGKLLRAGQIVSGSFNLLSDDNLQLDISYWDAVNNMGPLNTDVKESLNQLWNIEKQAVFQLLESMGIELTPLQREKIDYIPTQNLQAFFAYCRGLDEQDAGNLQSAATFFRQAATLDPSFNEAVSKVEQVESMNYSGSDAASSAAAARKSDPDLVTVAPSSVQENLIESRLNNLENNLGSNFIPGADQRQSAEETGTKIITSQNLPDPPPPPPPSGK
jgi:tetratricopeptide (TPR) repeat protein